MVQAFLLTYRTFTTAGEVLNALSARFTLPPAASTELPEDHERRRVAVRMRVFKVLKTWVDMNFRDCLGDVEFLAAFDRFADRMAACGMDTAAMSLKQGVTRVLDGAVRAPERIRKGKPPKPSLPKKLPSSPCLLDFHSEEIARQLTLVEHALFQRITPWELQQTAWLSTGAATTAPNVVAMLQLAERIRDWVATTVVTQESPDGICPILCVTGY